jgi:dTDP-4-dehydrorhamnose 3,5-epimerase
MMTVRPGIVKGWGMHEHHEDRYIVLRGEVLIVLYDDRPSSPTRGLVSKVHLSEWNRRLMNIPIGVWHAYWNIGDVEALAINFPTLPYQHNAPDKVTLPIDTDKIPFHFPSGTRGG